ncbi:MULTISPECIES: PAS domain S-box protein [Halobacterium]|uniref:PAS domain S-box protein n=1 Tax=Halobacterium TaxID=2239 RepID=UPI00196483F6|nr:MULTISPECIES: PAS domain S-box protein [Halobacterium]MCF2165361.1 PAS domain S-box protein [Halobacterium salinarum]MCF2168861.1 PAS domain S-box protein [Halobacterium salinarum]MCF2239172.1 PAS domain S-box protein [Halobacterium salinarum]MDL0130649.1 PAS domain S-box protein [Halobacterium salinarum]QRY23263.1 PAS domain S-box protein [Halobacterium sp. GSL-19]
MHVHRNLRSAIRAAAHTADSTTALYDGVCDAAANTGTTYAYVYTQSDDPTAPTVHATAGDTDSAAIPTVPTAPSAGVTTVDTAGGRECHVPILDGDDRYATLSVHIADGTPAPTDDLRAVGQTIGLAAAKLTAEAARDSLADDLDIEQRQFRKLHSIAAQMIGCENERAIYQLAIDAAENILEFDICGIDIARDGVLEPVALSTSLNAADSQRLPDDEGIAGQTYQDTTTIIVDDLHARPDAAPAKDAYRSLLSVPIKDLGVFQAAAERENAFDDRDAEVVELLMAHVGETLSGLWSAHALRESERKYRTLIEQSHDAVTIHTRDGFAFVNEPATELFGRDESTLLDLAASDLVHPDDHDALTPITDDAVPGDDHDTFDARVQRPDGTIRQCEVSTTTITYEGDPAVLASIRDITERKRHEQALERKNDRLEQFASIVSHDLRSPLNVAKGSLELARNTGEHQHFDRAADALDRMDSLVEDVLALSRQGELVAETERTTLAEIAADAWASINAPDASVEYDAAAIDVDADPGRLQQLFENLFRNAVEHAGDDVTIRVGSTPEGFYVEDDGPGIERDAADTVFERGVSGTDTGTGFGLAIVREIADAHGWSITAVPAGDDAPADRGARFEITGVPVLA